MLTVSSRWALTLAGNHQPRQRVDLVKAGVVTRNIPVTKWTVYKDATASPRTTAVATIADTSLLPASTAALLTPFGTRLRFHRGIRYQDGTEEVPLVAELDIRDVTMSRPDMTLDVSCADLAARVSDQLMGGPTPAAHTSVLAELREVALTKVSGLSNIGFDYTGVADTTLPAATVWDGDRWSVVEQLADLLAAEAYFSADQKTLRVRPNPVPGTVAAKLYCGPGGTITQTVTSLTRAPNYVVLWSDPDEQGRSRVGYAADNNPASPTYVKGPHGYVVAIDYRPGPPPSSAVMYAAAAQLLKRYQGQARTCGLEAVPNPALEPGDTVEIRFFNGVVERHVVTSVTIPGDPGETMAVTTRAPGVWTG